MMVYKEVLYAVRGRAWERLGKESVGAVCMREVLTLAAIGNAVTTTAVAIAVEVPLYPGCHVAEEIEIPAHASGYMLESDQILKLLDMAIDTMLARRAAADDVDMQPTRPMRGRFDLSEGDQK